MRLFFVAVFLAVGMFWPTGDSVAGIKASNPPKVVVSIAPVHSIVAAVMNEVGRPVLLIDKTLSPHEFSLKPSQARALQNADLVIWIGPEMELTLQRPMQGLPQSAKTLALLKTTNSTTSADPHFWLDPRQGARIADMVVERLSALDPTNAKHYRQNGDILIQEIEAAEMSAANALAGFEAKPFMVFHNAFGPFVDHFKLNLVGAVQSSHSINPGAATIASLRKKMIREEIVCLTSQFGEPTPLVDVLLEGTVIRTVALDPLGVKIASDRHLYPELIKKLAKDLAQCLN